MWLINAHTRKLEGFWNENVKEYAILSHRWGDDEVSFRDIQDIAVASNMKGFAKIQKACEHAVNDGIKYLSVDTCCIDKNSSAELSEAINSMFRWYKASAVCYALLSDVHANAPDSDSVKQQIDSDVWFTRGWTLQELLAPAHVEFYDQAWEFLGTKQTLSKLLTLRTGIDEAILEGEPLSCRSIAQRMSWASHRDTTRVEDKAYCLLGIFDVNMPLLYGEREKAFLRLQEQIIRQSDDHTIFAWPIHRHYQPGLLADSAAAFANCQYVKSMSSRKGRSSYSLTNRGLSIKLLAAPFATDTYLVRLDCDNGLLPANDGASDEFRLGIFLRRLDEDDQYIRVRHEGKTFMRLNFSTWAHDASRLLRDGRPVEQIEVNVPQQSNEADMNNYKDRVNGFRIATPNLLEHWSSGKDRFKVCASNWNPQESIMSIKAGSFGTVGILDISDQGRKIKVIKLGFDFHYNPVCFIATNDGLSTKVREAQYMKEDQVHFLGIYKRSPFDTMAWSEVGAHGNATELSQHSGLWALKGDRVNGLKVWIGELAALRIKRGEFRDKVVWDVYLDNFKDGTLRKIFK